MKVVHVIASIDPKNGGLQAVVVRLASAQSSRGLEVHIVSYGGPAVETLVRQIGEKIPHFGKVTLHLLPDPDMMETLVCRNGRRVLKGILKGTSFVHIHGVWEPFLIYASKLARRAGIPYCVCPAGMLDHWSLAQKSWKKRLAMRLCYRRMLNEAAFLHVLNVDEVAAIRPLRLRSPKLIIPNGVFVEEFTPLPARGRFLERLQLAPGRRYILFISRLHFKKGADVLAMAFAAICDMFPDVDLVMAGPDDGAKQDFLGLVAKFRIDHRVHMIGPIYGDAKIEAIVDACCFCLPSRQEGFSMSITEALACGTPVVISDQCHFPEVAAVEAGLVVRVDPVEVAKALAMMLGDDDHARYMGSNGRSLVMEKFTWPAIADASIRGYRLSV